MRKTNIFMKLLYKRYKNGKLVLNFYISNDKNADIIRIGVLRPVSINNSCFTAEFTERIKCQDDTLTGKYTIGENNQELCYNVFTKLITHPDVCFAKVRG